MIALRAAVVGSLLRPGYLRRLVWPLFKMMRREGVALPGTRHCNAERRSAYPLMVFTYDPIEHDS